MKETESACSVYSIPIGIDMEKEATDSGSTWMAASMDGMS
jgi:hypothetical protein